MKDNVLFFNNILWLGLIYSEVSSPWWQKLMGQTVAFLGAVGLITILIEDLFP